MRRRVCAWCMKVIEDGPEPTTHGICPECAEVERARWKEQVEKKEVENV